jgi:phosphate transport system substrate-binding protein
MVFRAQLEYQAFSAGDRARIGDGVITAIETNHPGGNLAYRIENKGKVKSIAIDNGKGAVAPTTETIENGTYAPFSRPLFIYVNKASAEKPEVAAFVDFYLKNTAELAAEVGFVRLPEAISAKVAANWSKRRTGTQFTTPEGETVTGSLTQIYE